MKVHDKAANNTVVVNEIAPAAMAWPRSCGATHRMA